MPIGPSGCGKSTLYNHLVNVQRGDVHSLSNDSMRVLLYGDDYDNAWLAANNDKDFKHKVRAVFTSMLNDNNIIYLDNTNLSPKVRRFWLTEATRYSYLKVALVFDVDDETLLSRRVSRNDKTVPYSAVQQQLAALKQPVAGEFDHVYFVADILEGM